MSFLRKKNIAMVAYTNYSTDPRVLREAEAAVDCGYNVDVFALKRTGEPNSENIRGVNVVHLNQERYRGGSTGYYLISYIKFFIRCFFKITITFFKKRYALIHINNMPDFYVFIALVPKLLGAKIIFDIHDPMPNTFVTKFQGNKKNIKYRLLLYQERICAWFSDTVITVHEPLKRDILSANGHNPEKISVVANFADDEKFKLISEYNTEGKLKLIFHGTIAERFGLQQIVKLFKELPCRNEIYFKIIGEGDYSTELKRIISENNLGEIVDFENKFYPVADLPDKLNGFHAGLVTYTLSPATDYMLPVKMMEYISMGLPVITLPNKAISYYFCREDYLFYSPDDISSLGNLIQNLVINRGALMDARKRILQIRDKFLWSNEKIKYQQILKSLTQEK